MSRDGVAYEDFRALWIRALEASGLPIVSGQPVRESLDLCSMTRTCESIVSTVEREDAEPIFVTATLSWSWDALLTARMRSCEEDVLVELHGREAARKLVTQRPWIRVDVKLRASLPYGQPLPMPPARTWARWARETIARLDDIEPVVPEKRVKRARGGLLEILAWQGDPVAHIACAAEGALKLEAVEVPSWQAIELPRSWDDPRRRPEASPARQLTQLFARAKAALHAWTEMTDHLRHAHRAERPPT